MALILLQLVVDIALIAMYCAPSVVADPLHLPLFRASRSMPNLTGHSLLESRASGFTNDADLLYYTSIAIGTPPLTLNMLVTLITGDVLLASTLCENSQGCASTSVLYNFIDSDTEKQASATLTTVALGLGSASGYILTDTVDFAGFTISQMPFLEILSCTGLVGDPVSGIMGLAGSGLASTTATPFWQPLLSQLGAPEFSFWLSRTNDTAAPGGAFTLGGVNSTLYTGEIEFLDVVGTPSAYWSLTLTSLTVRGGSVAITSSTNLATFDVGTSYLTGPAVDVAAFWANVPGSSGIPDMVGFYQYPCSTSVDVTVSFGGHTWSIDPEDMNAGPIAAGSSLCVGALSALPLPTGPKWIFGAAFLRNVYSVFRETPQAVGFASLVGGTGGTPGTRGASKKLNIAAIAGGAAGGFAVIVGIVLFVCWRRWNRSKSRTEAAEKDGGASSQALPTLAFSNAGEQSTTMGSTQGGVISPYAHDAESPAHDVLVYSPEGLHLSAGYPPASPTSVTSGFSNRFSLTDPAAEAQQPVFVASSAPAGQMLPPGALPPGVPGPAVFQELRDLRAEVSKLHRDNEPPRYE